MNEKLERALTSKNLVNKDVEICTDISGEKLIVKELTPKSKECKWCGHLFYPEKAKQMCCCTAHEKSYESYKFDNAVNSGKDSQVLRGREVSQNMKDIAMICKKAAAEGLSYGRYVAKYNI